MDGWVDGWMGGWMGGWMDGWMDRGVAVGNSAARRDVAQNAAGGRRLLGRERCEFKRFVARWAAQGRVRHVSRCAAYDALWSTFIIPNPAPISHSCVLEQRKPPVCCRVSGRSVFRSNAAAPLGLACSEAATAAAAAAATAGLLAVRGATCGAALPGLRATALCLDWHLWRCDG